jgi:hypothetical protein
MITCQGNVGSGWGFAVDNIYLKALGRAVWAFALLEWNAVWCCELLEPNYMHKRGRRGPVRTSDHIADDLISLLTNPSDPHIGSDWLLAAQEFKRLVKVRNSIFHGQPGSTPTGEQRLFREGIPWTPETVDNAVAEFEACSHILRGYP